MPYAYFDRLSPAMKAVYMRSDSFDQIPLPDAALVRPHAEALRRALEDEDRPALLIIRCHANHVASGAIKGEALVAPGVRLAIAEVPLEGQAFADPAACLYGEIPVRVRRVGLGGDDVVVIEVVVNDARREGPGIRIVAIGRRHVLRDGAASKNTEN